MKQRGYLMTTQLNLFNRPTLNVLRDVKEQMAASYRATGLSREELCEKMNNMAGRYGVRLTKGNSKQLAVATLDKWLNPQDSEHYPSLNALEVFCAATDGVGPLRVMVEPLGGQVIDEQDARLLAWAKLYHKTKDTRLRMKKLEAEL